MGGRSTDERDLAPDMEMPVEMLPDIHPFYQSVIDYHPDAVFTLDRGGRIRSANPGVQRTFGYALETLRGRHWSSLVPPEESVQAAHRLDCAACGEPQQCECSILSQNGMPVEVRATLIPVVVGGEIIGIYAIVSDVREQKRAQRELQVKEQQYRSIVEATTDGLLILDLEDRIVEANEVACRMYGYSYEEMLRMNGRELGPQRKRAMSEEGIRIVGEGGTYEGQGTGLRKDGTTFYVEARGRAFTFRGAPAILGIVRDVTERMEAYELLERRVLERTRELSVLLDVSRTVASTLQIEPLLGLILDGLKRVVDYHAASIFAIVGEDLQTIAYRGPAEQDYALGRRLSLKPDMPVWPAIKAGDPVIIADVRGDDPGARSYRESVGEEALGSEFRFVTSFLAVPMLLGDRVLGLLTVSHGEPGFYTEAHAQLAAAIASGAAVAIENARLYEQAQEIAALEERQKLARELHDSVSQALYGIALGARTARTLLDSDNPRGAMEPLDYVLAQAHAGLSEMRALIFELRPEALEREGLVAALKQRAEPLQTRHGIDFHMDLGAEPDVPFVMKEALYRIAQEAIHNTTKHAQARNVYLRLTEDHECLVLEVRDDGKGFDPGGSFPGHLGLRSMRERATRLGGVLQLESSPHGGTAVRVTIPRSAMAAGTGLR